MRAAVGLFLTGATLFVSGCGVPDSKGLPPKIKDLDKQSVSREPVELEKLWNSFALELGLTYKTPLADNNESGKSRAAMLAELESYPTILSDEKFGETTDRIVKLFTTNTGNAPGAAGTSSESPNPSFETRCARIKQVTELTDLNAYSGTKDKILEGVRLFKLEYFLKDRSPSLSLGLVDTELGDQIVRTALVSLPPPRTGSEPRVALAIYGHGGANGLTYKEIAEVFGDLQNDFVIAAPSFPEEPICADEINLFTNPPSCRGEAISEASGVLRPFDTDANEILGVADCLTRSLYSKSTNPDVVQRGIEAPLTSAKTAEVDFAPLLVDLIDSYGPSVSNVYTAETNLLDLLRQSHPRTIILGSSRGAATALIALAKSGALHRDTLNLKETRSHFQCAAFLFPPTTFTMGRLRIALELFVKGLSEESIFAFLPTADKLADFFEDYREGNATLQETVDKYMTIDPLLNIHLVASALRNWSDPINQSGRLLLLHGRQDRVVGAENSQFFGRFMGKASRRVRDSKVAPGVITSVLSFKPSDDSVFPSTQALSLFQHGDSVFRSSKSIPDNTSAMQRALDVEELAESAWDIVNTSENSGFYNSEFMSQGDLTPSDALKLWLNSDCQASFDSP